MIQHGFMKLSAIDAFISFITSGTLSVTVICFTVVLLWAFFPGPDCTLSVPKFTAHPGRNLLFNFGMYAVEYAATATSVQAICACGALYIQRQGYQVLVLGPFQGHAFRDDATGLVQPYL